MAIGQSGFIWSCHNWQLWTNTEPFIGALLDGSWRAVDTWAKGRHRGTIGDSASHVSGRVFLLWWREAFAHDSGETHATGWAQRIRTSTDLTVEKRVDWLESRMQALN